MSIRIVLRGGKRDKREFLRLFDLYQGPWPRHVVCADARTTSMLSFLVCDMDIALRVYDDVVLLSLGVAHPEELNPVQGRPASD